jgi:subtilisin family serine protease
VSESSDPFQVVTSALVAQGIAVFAAAGNDGASSGPNHPSAPGSGPDVFSVGSIENTKFPTTYQLTDSNGRTLRYSSVLPIADAPPAGLTVQVMYSGIETNDAYQLEGCYEKYYALAAANLTMDPSTVILAVKNGICDAASKGQVAAAYGYKYFMSYETDDLSPSLQAYGDANPELDPGLQPIVVNVQDSKTILSGYTKHPSSYKIFFPSTYAAKSPSTLTGGFMSNYSSFGPVFDLTLKPQLSAPGGQILATWPLSSNGGYAVISGTSMSTPFMAGCYALIKSQNLDLGIKEVYALMMNSAGSQMPWFYDNSILSTPAQSVIFSY